MIDHINLLVSDIERSKRFFQEALSPLGYELLMEHRISGAGFGQAGKPDCWSNRCARLGCAAPVVLPRLVDEEASHV